MTQNHDAKFWKDTAKDIELARDLERARRLELQALLETVVKAAKAVSAENWSTRDATNNEMDLHEVLAALPYTNKIQPLVNACKDGIGKWLSAALSDPNVCIEMKSDIRAFFNALEIWEKL